VIKTGGTAPNNERIRFTNNPGIVINGTTPLPGRLLSGMVRVIRRPLILSLAKRIFLSVLLVPAPTAPFMVKTIIMARAY